MKDLYSLPPESWLLQESKWEALNQNTNETNFALGNGFVSCRAVLEENPINSISGTFFAGIFDSAGAQTPELVNAPNPFDFRASCQGEKLDVSLMKVLSHKRVLNMREGVLFRRTIFSNTRGKRFDYQSIRFLSMNNIHAGAMRIFITPLDEDAEMDIISDIDASPTNEGTNTEGRKTHLLAQEIFTNNTMNYLRVKTLTNKNHLAYAWQLNIIKGNKKTVAQTKAFSMNLKKNETVCFTKFFSLNTSIYAPYTKLKAISLKTLKQNVKIGFKELLNKHSRSWDKLWSTSDIVISGDKKIQRDIRFSLYHLIICGMPTIEQTNISKGEPVGIGAKALTGEGYRGHSFWDTEVFTLPFYIYTNPPVAKNLLLYRYNRLNEAKKIAKNNGYKGCMFPWESAHSGKEDAPLWYRDIDGTIGLIKTGLLEHHITADIAYGIWHYYAATGDSEFMLNYGLEILLESARFWRSRVKYDKTKKGYAINNVIGPDEFHEHVNNNAFTNKMAKWNLETAVRLYDDFNRNSPLKTQALAKKIGLKRNEFKEWLKISEIILNADSQVKDGLIEQFDGFLKKKKVSNIKRNKYGLPVSCKKLSLEQLNKTQFIKQADVMLMMYLHPDDFSLKQKRKNYNFYDPKTLHQSSLSPAMYAIMGIEIGAKTKAYKYFLASLALDLENINKNTAHGIHIACCGGNYQALINGFGGTSIRKNRLCFNPRLPEKWNELKYCLNWQGKIIHIQIGKKAIHLEIEAEQKSDFIIMEIFGKKKELLPGKNYVFHY